MKLRCTTGDNEMFIKNNTYKILDSIKEAGIGTIYKIKPEVGEECFVPLDGGLWEFGIIKENEMNKEKLQEIASTMTEEEFKSKYIIRAYGGEEILNINGEEFACPNRIGLKNTLLNFHKCCSDCKECWENSIKELKFKGENEMKELTLQQAFECEVGTKFDIIYLEGNKADVKAELYKGEFNENKFRWCDDEKEDLKLLPGFLNAKFIPIVEKEVSFMEAIKAYSEGNTIKNILDGNENIYKFEHSDYVEDKYGRGITQSEILNGKWYIIND